MKILFVCHGNICRSPMAEMILRHKLTVRGLEKQFTVDSVALSNEEAGNAIYPPARRILLKHSIPCIEHAARQITSADCEEADLILCMEARQIGRLKALCPAVAKEKLHLLLDYTDRRGDIADPWYTDDFEKAYREIERGCEGLVKALTQGE